MAIEVCKYTLNHLDTIKTKLAHTDILKFDIPSSDLANPPDEMTHTSLNMAIQTYFTVRLHKVAPYPQTITDIPATLTQLITLDTPNLFVFTCPGTKPTHCILIAPIHNTHCLLVDPSLPFWIKITRRMALENLSYLVHCRLSQGHLGIACYRPKFQDQLATLSEDN